MNEAKRKLTNRPVSELSEPAEHYTVDTDAINTQVGRALLQEQPYGNNHPSSNWSRTKWQRANDSHNAQEVFFRVMGCLNSASTCGRRLIYKFGPTTKPRNDFLQCQTPQNI